MRRRTVLAVAAGTLLPLTRRQLLAGSIAVAAGAAAARAPARAVRLGWLVSGEDRSRGTWLALFLKHMRELGYVEGLNLTLLLPGDSSGSGAAPIAALLAMKPDVIVVASVTDLVGLRAAHSSVPVVMTWVADPVAAGFAASLARPGGNVTGASAGVGAGLAFGLKMKWLELLRTLLPSLDRIGVLLDDSPDHPASLLTLAQGAKGMGIDVLSATGRTAAGVGLAIDDMARRGAAAIVVLGGLQNGSLRSEIGRAALHARLPSIGPNRAYADQGLLLSYGPSPQQQFELAARYVDKIANGARPGELPIEQPSRFELVVNRKVAAALGTKLPTELLLRADEVVG